VAEQLSVALFPPMPLLLTRHPFPDTTFGLWQIAEWEEIFAPAKTKK
jgi:hypothetical protein